MKREKKAENLADEVIDGGDSINSLISAVTGDIKKDFPNAQNQVEQVTDYLDTGNLAINFAISGLPDGGFPVGKITEIYGENSTAKSLLAQHALVGALAKGGIGVLVDSEYAFNPHWFKTLGGDPDKLLYYQPASALDAYNYMKAVVEKIRAKNKTIGITLVYDSIAASPSAFEVEHGLEKADMGKRAIEHGKGIRQMMGFAARQNVTWIAINQLRATFAMFGPDKDTVGGAAWKYAASCRIYMKKGKKITDPNNEERVIGIGGRLVVEKNRITAPFKQAHFEIYFDHGINPVSGYFDVLLQQGKITSPSQGWYQYGEHKFREKEFPDIMKKCPELLGDRAVDLQKIFPNGVVEAVADDDGHVAEDTD